MEKGYICRGIRNDECGYLLGAAKDLLEACEAALAEHQDFCKTCGDNCGDCEADKVINQIEMAISKAKVPPPKKGGAR